MSLAKKEEFVVQPVLNLIRDIKNFGYSYYSVVGSPELWEKMYSENHDPKKKQVFYFGGDYEHELTFLKDDGNDIILRQSLLLSKKKKNEILIPSSYGVVAGDREMEPCPLTEKPKISFCGNPNTHPSRKLLFEIFDKQTDIQCDFVFTLAPCHGMIDPEIESKEMLFTNTMRNAEFVFCPRGNGNFSIRFYEALISGRIPVIVESDHQLPFEEFIAWKDIIVISTPDTLVQDIVRFHKEKDIIQIQKRCKNVFEEFFVKKFADFMLKEIDFVFRLNYYTKSILDQTWNISFDERTGRCVDTDNNDEFYCPLENHHGTYYIRDSLDFKECLFHRFLTRVWSGELSKTFDQLKREICICEHYLSFSLKNYITPMLELYQSDKKFKEKGFLHRIGDVYFSTKIPIITKTKNIIKEGETHPYTVIPQNNIIMNLNYDRHLVSPIAEVQKYDVPFDQKENKLVWRGCANGICIQTVMNRPRRDKLVEAASKINNDRIDIGFVHNYEDYKGKGWLSIKEHLQNKFLVSIEGGDVATNLKWILYSNSVCLMSKPTMCGWFMEDLLEEWVHYIPLAEDFSDIEQKYSWCLNNIEKCEEISKNASDFMKTFMDPNCEKRIQDRILSKYVESVNIELIR